MWDTESVAVQRPGSGDVDQLSEKDQRQAAPLIDAFDLTVVSYYVFWVAVFSVIFVLISIYWALCKICYRTE